jgi:TetR/AcrR family transcriptional repressor of nem operon
MHTSEDGSATHAGLRSVAVSGSGAGPFVELWTEWSIMWPVVSIKTNIERERGALSGRPRAFVPEQAVACALDVFWHKGYEATSLDDLTHAMGLSRSSFYACFGSKQAVLMAAVKSYADLFYAEVLELAESHFNPVDCVRQILARIVDPYGGTRGCFFLNSVVELAPHDEVLAAYSRAHFSRLADVVSRLLERAGFATELAGHRANAALAMAMGAVTLRKADVSADCLQAILQQSELLLAASGSGGGGERH